MQIASHANCNFTPADSVSVVLKTGHTKIQKTGKRKSVLPGGRNSSQKAQKLAGSVAKFVRKSQY
jgi:hypothetical protein